MPIDGLVSGLDTNEIVNQLIDLERVPRTRMAVRRDLQNTALESINSIDAKLGAVNTAAAALTRSASWAVRSATTTDAAVATASAAGGAPSASITFTVTSLARAHGVATGAAVASSSEVIASGGTLTLTLGGEEHVLDVGGGTVAEVAAAINDADLGLRATAVNTGSGVRLQIDATATGVAGAFTIDDGLDPVAGGTVVTSEGADAVLTLGTGPGAYTVTSSTNVFTNLTDGLTVVARAVSATPVTVTVERDGAALADKVKALVDAVNTALGEIAARTAYDAATKTPASLTGDVGVRSVAQSLLRAVTDVVSQSALGSPGLAGVSIDRSGTVTFDRAKFLEAFEADPAAVERLFVQGATTTEANLRFSSASGATRPGTAAVEITQLPTKATVSDQPRTWPLSVPVTVVVRQAGRIATYVVDPMDTALDAMAKLQKAIDDAGFGLVVEEAGGALTITSTVEGSAGNFDVAWEGDVFYAGLGADIAGTIDGQPATGSGRTLTLKSSGSAFDGLSVEWLGDTTGPAGDVVYEPGLAQRLVGAVAAARHPEGGALAASASSRRTRIALLDRTIEAYDRRLVAREAQLRKQYAALEVALGRLQNTSTWLAGQIGGLMTERTS